MVVNYILFDSIRAIASRRSISAAPINPTDPREINMIPKIAVTGEGRGTPKKFSPSK